MRVYLSKIIDLLLQLGWVCFTHFIGIFWKPKHSFALFPFHETAEGKRAPTTGTSLVNSHSGPSAFFSQRRHEDRRRESRPALNAYSSGRNTQIIYLNAIITSPPETAFPVDKRQDRFILWCLGKILTLPSKFCSLGSKLIKPGWFVVSVSCS